MSGVQVIMIAFYLLLIVRPVIVGAPSPNATPLNDFVLFSSFAIWCVWWPGVVLSMVLFDRAWYGHVGALGPHLRVRPFG